MENSQDFTLEIFVRLLERQSPRSADPARGRFRVFLLTSLKHFLINDWNKANRSKRGGGRPILSLDAEETENQISCNPGAALFLQGVMSQNF